LWKTEIQPFADELEQQISTLGQAEGLDSPVACLWHSQKLEVYQSMGNIQQYSAYPSSIFSNFSMDTSYTRGYTHTSVYNSLS